MEGHVARAQGERGRVRGARREEWNGRDFLNGIENIISLHPRLSFRPAMARAGATCKYGVVLSFDQKCKRFPVMQIQMLWLQLNDSISWTVSKRFSRSEKKKCSCVTVHKSFLLVISHYTEETTEEKPSCSRISRLDIYFKMLQRFYEAFTF